jgi:hypothetical protein
VLNSSRLLFLGCSLLPPLLGCEVARHGWCTAVRFSMPTCSCGPDSRRVAAASLSFSFSCPSSRAPVSFEALCAATASCVTFLGNLPAARPGVCGLVLSQLLHQRRARNHLCQICHLSPSFCCAPMTQQFCNSTFLPQTLPSVSCTSSYRSTSNRTLQGRRAHLPCSGLVVSQYSIGLPLLLTPLFQYTVLLPQTCLNIDLFSCMRSRRTV